MVAKKKKIPEKLREHPISPACTNSAFAAEAAAAAVATIETARWWRRSLDKILANAAASPVSAMSYWRLCRGNELASLW